MADQWETVLTDLKYKQLIETGKAPKHNYTSDICCNSCWCRDPKQGRNLDWLLEQLGE